MLRNIFYAFVTILCLLPSIASASFNDVPETSAYYQPVKYLEDLGVIEGDNFNPDKKITKADFFKFVLKESNVEIGKKNVITGFKDVKRNVWYAQYVKKALDLGLIDKSENFYPTKTIKKADALQVIFNLKGIGIPKILGKNMISKFKDINRESRYAGLAFVAEEKKLFNEDLFRAHSNLTRGEVADILYKLSESQKSLETPTIYIEFENLNPNDTVSSQEKYPILVNVWETVRDSYLKKNDITETDLLYGAIHGIVDKLGDPYSLFQEPIEAEKFKINLGGDFEGIGVMVEMIEEKFTVISPLPNSPAKEAGLKTNDIITHVDETDIAGLSTDIIINLIKGPAGTNVKIRIDRNGQILNFTIKRAKINMEAVSSELLNPSKIGLITITNFTQNSAKEFAVKAAELIKNGAVGFVIDLRNNPGGYLDAVVSMLNNYVPKGKPILKSVDGNGYIETVLSSGPGELTRIKTVIMVNKGTASASEIFAGVLQDYGVGIVIGETTFGKGTVQQLINYGDGSTLKLTIAKWLTALDRDIEDIGIVPDIEIKDIEGTSYDEVLDRALQEVLKN